MKVFWIAIIIFVITCIFIGVHSGIMLKMSREIEPHIHSLPEYVATEEWSTVKTELKKISDCWSKYKVWAALTISTKDIEHIETALKKCFAFAEIKQTADFMGEYLNLEYIVDYLPQREGFGWLEIL